MSWRSVSLLEETGVPGENHGQTLSDICIVHIGIVQHIQYVPATTPGTVLMKIIIFSHKNILVYRDTNRFRENMFVFHKELPPFSQCIN